MPQMIRWRPFCKFNCYHEARLEPPALVHILYCDLKSLRIRPLFHLSPENMYDILRSLQDRCSELRICYHSRTRFFERRR
jgi:hypothetical protein